ncbi:MAG: HD domain-containing protein, partial [Treponema sp.]|nr:HD domain-containing protein [Treponema sp.]
GGHVERTSEYIQILVNAMMKQGVYIEELHNMDLESFVSSARLHDIGKISIPDSILNKPGKLDVDEYTIMKTHSAQGVEIINQMASRADDDEFLRNAKLFAGYHHEHWDGKGYPFGLKEIKIPIQGRIMAIVDVYDALMSERPYKKPFTIDETVKIIMDNAGTQFDPVIADVFFKVKEQFRVINDNNSSKA